MREPLAIIVHRVFIERTSTLLKESAPFTSKELALLCLDLRGQIHRCLGRLPALAFEPRPDRPQGESGWTAGEIISHNSDRLLWALDEAAITLKVRLDSLSASCEFVKQYAAREPKILSQTVAVEVLKEATDYVKLVYPVLQASDRGQTSARSHHGMMDLTAWFLLICIHDNGHLDQLKSRETN